MPALNTWIRCLTDTEQGRKSAIMAIMCEELQIDSQAEIIGLIQQLHKEKELESNNPKSLQTHAEQALTKWPKKVQAQVTRSKLQAH